MLLVEFEEGISPSTSAKVLALDHSLGKENLTGIIECVPSYCSLAVYFNPLLVSPRRGRRDNQLSFDIKFDVETSWSSP